MARARNIKPGFFTNETLCECSPLARLLFAGLWTICDYRGVAEYRPKRIKVQVMPYDEADIEHLISELEKTGFVRIFSVQGQRYLKVLNFERHQSPHKNEREAGTDYPDICEDGSEIMQLNDDGKNRNKDGTARADSLLLIPDSLSGASPTAPPAPPPQAKGERLPANWTLCREWGEWAEYEMGLERDAIKMEAAKFRDYWHAKPGKDGVKLDWQATWRNWIRGHMEKAKLKPQPRPRPAAVNGAPPMNNLDFVRSLGIKVMGDPEPAE